MPIAWDPKKMLEFLYIRRRKKKKQNQFLLGNAFNVYDLKVLGHFATKNYA